MALRSPNYPWEVILGKLQAQPNRWILLPEMTARPASLVRRVNRRRVRGIRAPGGIVQARAGWIGATTEGRTIADVYLRWREETTNGRTEAAPPRGDPLDEHTPGSA